MYHFLARQGNTERNRKVNWLGQSLGKWSGGCFLFISYYCLNYFQWTYTTFVTKWKRTVNDNVKFCKPCFKPLCGFLAIILWNRLLIFLSLVITGLNIYWSWPHPLKQDPVFPPVSLSHQEDSISLLSLSFRGRADRMEATTTENW